jgi:hypothetical protein
MTTCVILLKSVVTSLRSQALKPCLLVCKRPVNITKCTLFISLFVIIAGFLPSSKMLVPVSSATDCKRMIAEEHVANICYWDPRSFWYYPWGESVVHKGIDIFARKGDIVRAATSGVVIDKGYGANSGNYINILGPRWRIQYYAHLRKSNVRLFQYIHKGQAIGEIGNTGNAMGKPYHLHFSIMTVFHCFWRADDSVHGWKKSLYLNPEKYFEQ